MSLLIYIIKTVFISGLLFGYYSLFLRNRPFHRFNRIFLLSVPVLSFLLPLCSFDPPAFWNLSVAGSPVRLLGVGRGNFEEAVTVYARGSSRFAISGFMLLGICSILFSMVLGIRFIRTIRLLLQLRRSKPTRHLPEATVYFVTEKGTPFSFLKNIFWGEIPDIDSVSGAQILRHEIFHVKKNHSLDILFMEINFILCWFNPFFYMIRRELRAIHEYCADAYAALGTDEFAYASLLLMNESGTSLSLSHPFFKNQIKRRITMITKIRKNKKALLGRLMVLPLIILLIGLFSFKIGNHFSSLKTKSIRVVIDAGHGGNFTGTRSGELLEKNINLVIAKKIQSLAPDYNVEVIMSRETDMMPGSNDLHESLEYIAALPKNKDAALFISIHANATETAEQGKLQTTKSGFQIYIPKNSSAVYESSLKLGSLITEMIKPDYSIESELKQSTGDGGNILILKNATVPAVLIECGYMDNPNDQKYLQDEKNQEKIARDILEGIKIYHSQNTVYSGSSEYSIVNTSYSGSSDFEDPLSGAVWISEEQSRLIADNRLKSLDYDAKRGLAIYCMKDGKKYYSNMPEEIRKISDSIYHSNPDNQSPVLTQVETPAEFPGGQKGWYDYLVKNLNYPAAAEKKEIQGEVVVAFVVRIDGTLSDIHALSGPQELRASSVLVVKNSGKWIPAKNKGVVVESYSKQPINYKLSVK
jgi:N-acetylmuramoyl-L-alanine amidase